ncbi:MAG: hypothetical protein ABJF10_24865 [Chthoniobacter sp.]|uniref:hypothetical protein n=1 Tax=Chthoniobacter sp. TaxID=2510640 RepID=UPI0032A7CF8B
MNEFLPSVRPRHSMQSMLAAIMVGCTLLAGVPTSRALDPATVTGDLLIDAKGEVEIFYNGRKLVLQGERGNGQHFVVKVPARAYQAGDAIVLHVRSPVVYRAIVAAINLTGKAGQIAIKKSDWRYLGEEQDARKITAAEIQASQTLPVSASPDPNGAAERDKLGILPESQGGSEWVKTEKQSNGWYCVGFVITPEMLKSPLPVHR